MINIFKKKTIYKFKTSEALSWKVHQLDTTDRTLFSEAVVRYEAVLRYVAKHAKKQFRWVRKSDRGKKEYHYYLDEKHMTYMDLAWPEFTKNWRQSDFSWDSALVSSVKWDPVLISLVRRSMPNLVASDLLSVQPMTGPIGIASVLKARVSKGKK